MEKSPLSSGRLNVLRPLIFFVGLFFVSSLVWATPTTKPSSQPTTKKAEQSNEIHWEDAKLVTLRVNSDGSYLLQGKPVASVVALVSQMKKWEQWKKEAVMVEFDADPDAPKGPVWAARSILENSNLEWILKRHNASKPKTSKMMRQVAALHGAAGPFAMAGYRMAQHALRVFKSKRWDWSLRVIHHTPRKVQWSCIADGVQAATGVSAGKLSLLIKFVKTAKETLTVIRHRKHKKVLRYKLLPSFVKRFLNTPRKKLKASAKVVATLPETKIFKLEK